MELKAQREIAGKQIDPTILQQLDALIYDIQDSGMRHYTYISTMLCALEASAEHNKPLYILDRPNFLGLNMEGPLVEPELKSFISIASIPLRHGMTVGELARYFNTHILKKKAPLQVVAMKQYSRIMRAPGDDRALEFSRKVGGSGISCRHNQSSVVVRRRLPRKSVQLRAYLLSDFLHGTM